VFHQPATQQDTEAAAFHDSAVGYDLTLLQGVRYPQTFHPITLPGYEAAFTILGIH
jgi:hypothetical protein